MAAKYTGDNRISLLGREKPIGRVMLSKRTGDSIGEQQRTSLFFPNRVSAQGELNEATTR